MNSASDRIAQLTPAKRALLAAKLGRGKTDSLNLPPITLTDRVTVNFLSFAQERMWFFEQFAPGTAAYHVPLALRLIGLLDVPALGTGLTALVTRHDVLRTSFPSLEGRPRAVTAPPGPVAITIHDLESFLPEERVAEARRIAALDAIRPFDLAHGPLLRATLLRLAPDDHALLLTLHHLVTDGESASLIFREIAAGYRAHSGDAAAAMPPLPFQYADYAAWQRDWLAGPVRETLLSYWREQLAGCPAFLELPADRLRPATQSFRGGSCPLSLPPALTIELHHLARRAGVTSFMVLLAAFQALLARITGQTDIVVGTPMAHRAHVTLEPLVGCFVNTLPLRTRMEEDPSVRALLAQVKENCLAAHAHQGLPFELLVDALQPARSLSYAPLFQVVFALQPYLPDLLDFAGLSARPLRPRERDLQVRLIDDADGSR